MKMIGLILKGIILLAFLAIAVSNTQVAQFFYLPGQSISLPLIVVLFGAFVIGVLFGLFALFGRLLRLRSENNRLRAEVKKTARLTENEIATATSMTKSSEAVQTASSQKPAPNTVKE